jgi:hypothetical protein
MLDVSASRPKDAATISRQTPFVLIISFNLYQRVISNIILAALELLFHIRP